MPLSPEQKKAASETLDSYGSILSEINAGGADAKTLYEKFNKTTQNVTKALDNIIGNADKSNTLYWEDKNTVNVSDQKPCGILKRNPKYHKGDIVLGGGISDNAKDEIKASPLDYGDLVELTGGEVAWGTGGGAKDKIKIRLPEIGVPDWISELEKTLTLFKKRKRTKSYYDPESLARGIPAKQKEKKVLREKSAYIILDVSGSMFAYSYRGESIIEILAAYIPPLARQFEGWLWQVDQGKPTKEIPLKELQSEQISGMEISGRRGTAFDIVFMMIRDEKEKIKEENPNADFITILFTDTGVSWNYDLMPENFVLVTLKEMEGSLPNLDEEKNQKAILIEVDKKRH